MLALYVSNVSYFLGVNVAIAPQWQHQKNVFVVLKCPQFTPRCYQRTCSVLQTVTFLFPTALTDMFFTSACTSSWKMLVPLTTASQ